MDFPIFWQENYLSRHAPFAPCLCSTNCEVSHVHHWSLTVSTLQAQKNRFYIFFPYHWFLHPTSVPCHCFKLRLWMSTLGISSEESAFETGTKRLKYFCILFAQPSAELHSIHCWSRRDVWRFIFLQWMCQSLFLSNLSLICQSVHMENSLLSLTQPAWH